MKYVYMCANTNGKVFFAYTAKNGTTLWTENLSVALTFDDLHSQAAKDITKIFRRMEDGYIRGFAAVQL